MNFDTLGNIGDFVGGIAVIISVVYLAIQIRKNTQEVQNSAVQNLLELSVSMFGESMSSHIPEVIEKQHAGEPLSKADDERMFLFIRRNLQLFELVYLQYRGARVSQEIMDSYEARIKSHFPREGWEA